MVMKSMEGKRREQFGDFTERAENTDRQLLSTYIYYSNWELSFQIQTPVTLLYNFA